MSAPGPDTGMRFENELREALNRDVQDRRARRHARGQSAHTSATRANLDMELTAAAHALMLSTPACSALDRDRPHKRTP